jgi:probable HAF family extracellular repeat protein
VVVGESTVAAGYTRAFRWTSATGMKDLSSLYPVGSGSYFQYANAVSADGLHVVGYGYNRSKSRYEAYSTN